MENGDDNHNKSFVRGALNRATSMMLMIIMGYYGACKAFGAAIYQMEAGA